MVYKPKVKKLKAVKYKGRRILFTKETGRMDTGTYYDPRIEPYTEITATWMEKTEGLQTIKLGDTTKEQVMYDVMRRINRFIRWDKEPNIKGNEIEMREGWGNPSLYR